MDKGTLLRIANWYLKMLVTSDEYNSPNPVKDRSLLFVDFNDKVNNSIEQFNEKYPDIKVVIVETYRSNDLQQHYFNTGASKIRTKGMHHYGIAVDLAFEINGQFSYKGDYDFLRHCHEDNGLFLLGAWDIGHVQYIPVADQQALRDTVNDEIVDFQQSNGLTVDGVVGEQTIAKAKEVFADNQAQAINGKDVDSPNAKPDE